MTSKSPKDRAHATKKGGADADQAEAFRAKAREIGADDDGGSDAVMKRLASQKRDGGVVKIKPGR